MLAALGVHTRLMLFETTMSQFGNNTGIEVPADVIEELGGGRRPALVVTVNGYTYRSTVGVMAGKHLIPFSADKRRETGIGGGDAITVDVQLDTAPRTVEVPEDLAEALASAGLRPAFDALSPSAQKAHVTAVAGAKAAETRQRRIDRVVESLS
ncbi:hypothetical protein GCM10027058_09820 [Microbacterium neimengense]